MEQDIKIVEKINNFENKQYDYFVNFIDRNDDYTDIIELAIELEGETAKLYRELSERVEDPKVKETLIRLAEEEDDHGDTLDGFLDYKPGELDVKKVKEFRMAQNPDLKYISKSATIRDVLLYAIHNENEACNLYKKLAQLSDNPEGKDTFIKLSRIELEHKNRLEMIMNKHFKDTSYPSFN